MHELLRRMAIHGGLTAIILAVIGVVLAEMAATSVMTPVGTRLPASEAAEASAAAESTAAHMRRSIPIAMAAMGFVFVAAFEGLRHLVTGKQPKAPPAPPVPDEAEVLLEQLLSEAEAKSTARTPPAEQTPAPAVSLASPVNAAPQVEPSRALADK